jgi:hypothetical protein
MEDLYVVDVVDGCVVVSANIIIDDMFIDDADDLYSNLGFETIRDMREDGGTFGVEMYRFPFADDVARAQIVRAFHRWNNCTDLDAPSEFVLADWVIG